MAITVYDVPIANQVLKRSGLSHFKKAVILDDLIANLLKADKPPSTYTKPKLLEVLGLPRAYCSAKNDITESLPLCSLRRNKYVFVPRSDARRVLKERADELIPLTDAPEDADDVDGVVFPDLTVSAATGESAPSTQAPSMPAGSMPALERIVVPASQQFVDADGSVVPIALYGIPTHERIRFDVSDIYRACNFTANRHLRDISGVTICDAAVDGVCARVVDMLNMLRLIAHFDRVGAAFAKSVMVWCSKIVFSIQYGDVTDPRPDRMAQYMRTVAGRSCPNPMAECTSKMVYLEIMGSVANLRDSWPELDCLVPAGKCASEYKVAKPGEGSGHRFGDNARAIRAIHANVEPECYDYRPTTLDRAKRQSIERGVADTFAHAVLPVNPARRFSGDTEIFVVHDSEITRMWKYMQLEATNLEEELAKVSESTEMRELQHKIELDAARSEVKDARALTNKMSIAIQALPSAAKRRFDEVMAACNQYA
jgi:hypothetical protein